MRVFRWNFRGGVVYDVEMSHEFPRYTQCLSHQLPESHPSPLGLVCPICRHRMRHRPPTGQRMAFWESQPGAYSLQGEPCFIFTLMWEDFRIRSLHPAGSDSDPRARRIPIAAEFHETDWHDDFPLGHDSDNAPRS